MFFQRSKVETGRRVHQVSPAVWIKEGREMAHEEEAGVFDSIELKFKAESKGHRVIAEEVQARGSILFSTQAQLEQNLIALDYTRAMFQRATELGRAALHQAIAFGLLNVVLAFVAIASVGPVWAAFIMALVVCITSVSVEEYFVALDKRDVQRQGVFIALGAISLAATFYLGNIRGMFLSAIAPPNGGRASNFLQHAGPILQYALGILAAASEFLCGFKLFQVRVHLLSAGACAARKLDQCTAALVELHGDLEEAREEPEIRRYYRTVGARQFLASKEREQERFNRWHPLRALAGALVALLVIVLFLIFSPNLLGASSEAVNIALLDLSKSTPATSYAANLAAIPEIIEQLNFRDRIVVLGIGGDFGTTEKLFDAIVPADTGFMGLGLQVSREEVLAKWKDLARSLPSKPRYDQTDILGSLRYLTFLGVPLTSRTRLFIFSDLRQSSREVDLEHVPVVDAAVALKKIQRSTGVVPLQGVSVYLMAVEPRGTTERYAGSLRGLWSAYFKAAGADIKVYTLDRKIPELR